MYKMLTAILISLLFIGTSYAAEPKVDTGFKVMCYKISLDEAIAQDRKRGGVVVTVGEQALDSGALTHVAIVLYPDGWKILTEVKDLVCITGYGPTMLPAIAPGKNVNAPNN